MITPYKVDKDIKKTDENGNVYYRTDFILDSATDVEEFKSNYSCYPAGSTGVVAPDGTMFVLDSKGNYHEREIL